MFMLLLVADGASHLIANTVSFEDAEVARDRYKTRINGTYTGRPSFELTIVEVLDIERVVNAKRSEDDVNYFMQL